MNFKSELIKRIKIALSLKYINKYNHLKNTPKIIYGLSPRHGNMGDQAITFASMKFLKENFGEYEIIELERDQIYDEYFAIKRILNSQDLIVLHGGGNMGNLYIQEEEPRRFFINKFKKNKIISMTQTITFTNDDDGNKELNKTIKTYNKHKNLTLLAREDISYDKMKSIFNCNVIKVPDIVFYLNNSFSNSDINRNGIMTCLRSDKESIWKSKKDEFINRIKENYGQVFIYDTVVDRAISQVDRERELTHMWSCFRKHNVIITDRLHGMIFATITNTPCIVLKSFDHKVVESYKWISNLDYIRVVDSLEFEKIKPIIDEFNRIKAKNNLNFNEKYFNKLIDRLKGSI